MRKSGARVRAIWAPKPAELAVIKATFVAAIVNLEFLGNLGNVTKTNTLYITRTRLYKYRHGWTRGGRGVNEYSVIGKSSRNRSVNVVSAESNSVMETVRITLEALLLN